MTRETENRDAYDPDLDAQRVVSGVGAGVGEAVTLLSNVAVTGSASDPLAGGSYIWAAQGTFGGATLSLQSLGPDGSTYMDVTTLTAAGQKEVRVGVGEVLRVAVTGGTPSALYSNVRRVA